MTHPCFCILFRVYIPVAICLTCCQNSGMCADEVMSLDQEGDDNIGNILLVQNITSSAHTPLF